jgi:transcriptional regulator with XRE-family HTH domain
MATWNLQLRELRRGRNVSTSDLSSSSGISQASIHSYELGRRHPTREHLCRLLECLGADTPTRIAILSDAGYAAAAAEQFVETSVSEMEAIQLLHRRPWPAFLVNHRADVLAVNEVAERVVGLPPTRPGRPPNVLTFVTRRALATRCVNWDMTVTVMIRGYKAGNPQAGSLHAPGPSFAPLVDAVCAGDPALVAKFTKLWETMPAWRGAFAGVVYETIWKAKGGQRIRFNCAINCLDAEAGLYFHDWIPADSKSFLLLEKLLADPAKTR